MASNGFPTYSFPVSVPPGVKGQAPSLAIKYTGSPTPNSALGSGWTLSGVSAISRCQMVYDTDHKRGDYHYQPTDKLCLDGQRLIQVYYNGVIVGDSAPAQSNDALGGSGLVREFRTENHSYARIRAYGSAGGNSAFGPDYFKVWTKDGRVLEYGNNNAATSSQIAVAPGSKPIMAWALNRSSDLHGNYIDYKYQILDTAWGTVGAATGREWNLVEIDYTGNSVNGQAPTSKVLLSYVTKPDYGSNKLQDRSEAYHEGYKTVSTQLLTGIRTYVNAQATPVEVRAIKLGYDNGPVTNRSRLTSITECVGASESTCLSPVKFAYTAGGDETYVAHQLRSGSSANPPVPEGPHDFYQSGMSGYTYQAVVSGQAQNAYYRSNGDGTFSAISVDPGYGIIPAGVDFNGDGLQDGYVSNADGTLTIYFAKLDGTYDVGPKTSFVARNVPLTWKVTSDTSGCRGAQNSVTYAYGVCYNWTAASQFFFIDFNGDGIGDIIVTSISSNDNMPATYNRPAKGSYAATGNLGEFEPQCMQSGWSCSTQVYKGDGQGGFIQVQTNMASWSMYRTSVSALISMTGNGLMDPVGYDFDFPLTQTFKGANTVKHPVAWLSQGDGNFLPAMMPDSSSTTTNGCFSINGSLCFDPDGGGLKSNLLYGAANGGGSAQVGYQLNNGLYSYTAYGQASVIQMTNLILDDVNKWPPTSVMPNNTIRNNTFHLASADVNGDGRDDIIRVSDNPSENAVFLSRGDGTYLKSTSFNLAGYQLWRSDGTAGFGIADFTGRGNVEFLASNSAARVPDGDVGPYTPYSGPGSTNYGAWSFTKADGTPPDLLTTITGQTGLVTRITHTPLNNSNGRYNRQPGTYPKAMATLPWWVITTVVQDTGVSGGTIQTDYIYKGLKGNIKGRGVLGFSEVIKGMPGPDGSPVTQDTIYSQDYPYIGRISTDKILTGSLYQPALWKLVHQTDNIYCELGSSGAVVGNICPTTSSIVRPYLKQSTETSFDLDGSVLPTRTTTYTVNSHADPLTETLVVTGADVAGVQQSATSITTNTYWPENFNDDNWLLARKATTTVQNTVSSTAALATSAGTAAHASDFAGTPPTLAVSASPASVNLSQPTPGSYTQTITIAASGTSLVAPLSYTLTTDKATAIAASISGNTVTFTFTPTQYGQTEQANFKIAVTDYKGQWGSVTVPVAMGIGRRATTSTVTPSVTSVAPTVGMSFAVAVAGINPTGSATFADSLGNPMGTVNLVNGAAAFSFTGFTSEGNHTVTATYGGDSVNAPSTNVAQVTVAKLATSTSVSASSTSFQVGNTISYTANVAGGAAPGGQVAFYDNGSAFATVGMNGGSAVASRLMGAAGRHDITAQYLGDVKNAISTSSAATVTPYPATPGTNFTSIPTNVVVGRTYSMAAAVILGYGPTGSVDFRDATTGTDFGAVALNGGSAAINWSVGSAQAHQIQAIYSGDANNYSTSAATNINAYNVLGIGVAGTRKTLSGTQSSYNSGYWNLTSSKGSTVCYGTIYLTAAAGGGSGNYTYYWTNSTAASGVSGSGSGNTFTVNIAVRTGQYASAVYTVAVTDGILDGNNNWLQNPSVTAPINIQCSSGSA
ncbi:hypothetical protein WG78_01785 [Amantichitinum ursilacus]|uniref:FG-GAP repeat protein n=1 Tax=Amantichitinum ursilacus TaxID=857265 RepID=A0A0N0GR56_9NEIS|nr:hypothetical protein WG78_01785 [Amantichitinum ursilacus]